MKQIASSMLKLFYKPIKALFIALLILQSMNTYAGVLVTVPSTPGTDTTSLLPTNRRYNYSAARMIYTATEIGSTGTITKIAFGECCNKLSATDFTIPALIPINSSRVIPGFLGIPEVITTTSLPAVFE